MMKTYENAELKKETLQLKNKMQTIRMRSRAFIPVIFIAVVVLFSL